MPRDRSETGGRPDRHGERPKRESGPARDQISPRKKALAALAGATVVAVIGGGLMLAVRGRPDGTTSLPPPRREPPAVVPSVPSRVGRAAPETSPLPAEAAEASLARRESAAAVALREARRFEDANPGRAGDAIANYETLVRLHPGSVEAAEARVAIARLQVFRDAATKPRAPAVADTSDRPPAEGPADDTAPAAAAPSTRPPAPAKGDAEVEKTLATFDDVLKRDEYEGAKGLVKRLRSEAPAHAAALDAAVALADGFIARRDAIRGAVKALRGSEAEFGTRKGKLKGIVQVVDADGVTLLVQLKQGPRVLGESKTPVRWGDLTVDEERTLAYKGGWRPDAPTRAIVSTLAALWQRRADLAERELAAAAGHPLEAHYRGRIEALRVGEAEAAGLAAWRAIEKMPPDDAMSAAEAKRLLAALDEFERKHAGTKAGELAAPRIPELRKAATWIAGGRKTNYALSFAGTKGLVNVPDADAFDMPKNVTVEAWVKPSEKELSRGSGECGILCHESWANRTEGGYYLMFLSYTAGQEPSLAFRLTGPNDEHRTGAGPVGGAVKQGEWAHVAGTYDGQKIRVFVNGRMVGSSPCEFELPPSSLHLSIGARQNGGCDFDGSIDEVRLSSVCRYTQNFPPPNAPFTPDEHTVALWHFDEAQGNTVSDATGAHGGTFQVKPDPAWVEGCPQIGHRSKKKRE